jgi:hypothetical protein
MRFGDLGVPVRLKHVAGRSLVVKTGGWKVEHMARGLKTCGGG